MTASAIEPEPQAIRFGFVKRVLRVALVLAALAAAISVAGKLLGHLVVLAGHTEDRTLYEVVIDNDVLVAPANAIRFEEARRNGVAGRLDLYLRWPTMDGYSAATRDDFNNVGGSRNILFLAFEPRAMSRDMSGRYAPIYRSLVEKNGAAGKAGIVFHTFTAASGYVGERLAVAIRPGGGESFVARCLAGPAAAESLAPCERDLQVGRGLSLTYRFPERLLADWPTLDRSVREAAEAMLRGSRS